MLQPSASRHPSQMSPLPWSILIVLLVVSLSCYQRPARHSGDGFDWPYSPVTTISFEVDSCAHVTLTLYSILGEAVGVPFDSIACGRVNLDLDIPRVVRDSLTGRDDTLFSIAGLESGIYFYRLETSDTAVTKKMVIMK